MSVLTCCGESCLACRGALASEARSWSSSWVCSGTKVDVCSGSDLFTLSTRRAILTHCLEPPTFLGDGSPIATEVFVTLPYSIEYSESGADRPPLRETAIASKPCSPKRNHSEPLGSVLQRDAWRNNNLLRQTLSTRNLGRATPTPPLPTLSRGVKAAQSTASLSPQQRQDASMNGPRSPALKSRNVIPGTSSWGQRLVSSPSLPWGIEDLPRGHSRRHAAAFTPACYRVQVPCCDRATPPLALGRRLEGREKQAGPAPEAE